MFKKIRTVIYHVNDIEKAKEWYGRITGIKPYFDEPFYVGFDINGFELGLDPDTTDVVPGNNSIAYWSVDDIHKALENLKDNGAAVVSDIQNVGDNISVAIVKDPFGNCVGLISKS
jgi:predicted enzyme related to lactoylglutathione lyase